MRIKIGSIERDDETGEIRFDSSNDEGELKSAFKNILRTTDVGQRYKNDYASPDREDTETIVNLAQRFAGGVMVSEDHLVRALTALMDTNTIPRNVAHVPAAAPTEPVVDTTPRDKNGKPLTAVQLKYREYREFAESASSAEITQRRRSDPDGFGAYVRSSLQQEMQERPVGDAVTAAGQPTSKTRVNAELASFVANYHKEPIANLRPRSGFVSLAGESLAYSKLQSLIARATDAGLL